MSFRVSFCSCVFSLFSNAITSLGEERANLSAFHTFVRFVLVWICRFPLPLGVREGLRFVIVTFPRLFSYIFFICNTPSSCSVRVNTSEMERLWNQISLILRRLILVYRVCKCLSYGALAFISP